MPGRYMFGDGDAAARRLALVARTFDRSSRALLARAVPEGPDVVVDLGCGPGYTTRLIAEVCRPRRTVGIDVSPRFVERARELTAERSIDYAVADVAASPLPGAPADALHARLLLAHLPRSLEVVGHWRAQARPHGVLVLDEVESIEPPPGVLSAYEDLVVRVVAAGGGSMYAGRLLEPLGGRCVGLDVDAADAAAMFGLNLTTWRGDAIAHDLASRAELDVMAAELAAVAARPGRQTARWVLRQLVLSA